MSRPSPAPLAAAIALAFSTAAVSASDFQDDTTRLDTVIVTGTRASHRTALESTAPIDVLNVDDLRKAGVVNGELGSALQVLLPSFNFPHQSNSGGGDHVRAAQLRGLSPDQVLVLINGKRRHSSALVNTESKIGKGTTPVDFNAIPVSAIKRIEVLRDGAGALYGSDAVAGVINIILDDAPQGGTIEASYGAHHTKVAPIGRTLTDGQTGQFSGNIGTALGNEGGFVRAGVEYKRRRGTNRAGFDQLPPWKEQTPDNLALLGQRNYVVGDGSSRDVSLWLNTDIPLSDVLSAYGFGTYYQRESEGANYFRYPDDEANWKQIHPRGFRPISEGDNQDIQLVAGIRGQWEVWTLDASLDHGRNAFTYELGNSLNASLGPDSPTHFKIGDFDFRQTTANLDLGRLWVADTHSHTLGLGAEARREHYRTGAGDPASYAAGPWLDRPTGSQAGGGLTPQDEANLTRNVLSAYVNLSSTLGEQFSTDIAARYEHYDDFGSELTGKIAARYAFTPGFALRGAVSNNFRAPSLSQIGYESTNTGYIAGGQLLQSRQLSVNNPIARALGASTLKPETSRNISLGVTGQVGRLDISLDFFQIDIDDRIALSERISGPALVDFVLERFGTRGLDSANFFVNAADTRTRGVELVSNWRQSLGDGELLLTGAWSYAKTELENIVNTPAQLLELDPDYVLFGAEETNTLTDVAPRTRLQLSAGWNSDAWSLTSRVSRHGSARRVFDFGGGYIPDQTYSAKWQLDAEVEYRVSTQLSFAIGGQNLTDNYPDLSNEDIYYFGNLPYDVLSPIGSNGAYWYARVRYAF